MNKKVLMLLMTVLIISAIFTGCASVDDAISIYNRALEKTNEVQRRHETASFEILLKNEVGEYKAETKQEIITDKGFGISAGSVKVYNNDQVTEFEIYEKKNNIYAKEVGTENYNKSSYKMQFIPDIREKCIEILIEMVQQIEDEEDFNDSVTFDQNDGTGEVFITGKMRHKEVENMMLEIVKESIVSHEVKKEVAEETVEKMKKAVESLGENISEEEIREAVNKQIEIIDKEFETIFEGYECSDLVFTTTINKEGYISRERIFFKAKEKEGEGSIEIRIDYAFGGPSSEIIRLPRLTEDFTDKKTK